MSGRDEKEKLNKAIDDAGRKAGADKQVIEDVKAVGDRLLDVGVPERALEETAGDQFGKGQDAEHHRSAEQIRRSDAAANDPSDGDNPLKSDMF